MVAVTSTVTHSVTWGAVNADDTIACAVILRTPLIGVRVSRSPGARCGVGVGALNSTASAAARSTSPLVTMPPSPVARTAPRSTPRSLASLRTAGLAKTRGGAPDVSVPEDPECRPLAASTSPTGRSGWVGVVAAAAASQAGAGGAGAGRLRGRRDVEEALGP